MNGEKTKILFIITQGELGGAQRYVFDLATTLAGTNPHQSPLKLRGEEKGSYEVLVAVGNESPALKNSLTANGMIVQELRYLKRNIHPVYDILAVWELNKLIQQFQPDIIHLNSSKAGVIGSLAAKLARKRNVIFTAHGFAFLEPNHWLVRQIYFWAEKIVSYFRRVIITVSEYDRQAAIKSKLCPAEKLITIYNGIQQSSPPRPPAWTSPKRNRAGEGELEGVKTNSVTSPSLAPSRGGEKLIIGTIARDYPTKDLKTLREAFRIVKSEFPAAELRIIQSPNAAAELDNLDIYVCSSIKEGFPYSILEAMAAGLPIVSTNVGGIPEAITNGKEGLLVPPKNPQALATAIKKLILEPGLAEQLSRAAQQKIQEFSLDQMLTQTEAVYQALISSRNSLP